MRHEEIKSKAILPRSPWWGGFYERMVRSMKTALRKTIGKSLLTFEELETVLCQIEASINSRPLAYQSEDDLGQAITPLHLIYGSNIVNTKCIPTNNVDQCLKRLNYVQQVLNDQWKRFYRNYLSELRQHHLYRKDGKGIPELKLGDVVVVKDDGPLPRSKWPLDRVNDLISGKDGFIRGAKISVITRNGLTSEITRPIQKLIPLEITNEESQPQETNVVDENQQQSAKPEAVHEVEDFEEEVPQLTRPTRRAAVAGQYMRKLREKYL